MWRLGRQNFGGNIEEACPRLGAQDVMTKPWNMSSKSHSPPAGRYVQALIDLLRSLGDTEQFTFARTIECLAKVAQGEQYIIDTLIELLDRTRNENNRQQTVLALEKIAIGNRRAAETLINVFHTTQDNETLRFAALSLETLLSSDLFSYTIANLKDCLQDHVQETAVNRYRKSFSVLWYCAQNLSYPDFYSAWYR